MTAGPAPRRVSLRTSSRTLVGSALWRRIERAPSSEPTNEGWVFHPDEIAGTRPASVRVAAVVFLGRRGADPSRGLIQRVAPAHAALALLPCLNLARTLELTALLGRLTPWATAVPAYDLQRAELPAMAAAVERLLEP
jgi:hypothetical protein